MHQNVTCSYYVLYKMQFAISTSVMFFKCLFENQAYLVMCVVKLTNENCACNELYYYIYNSISVEYSIIYKLKSFRSKNILRFYHNNFMSIKDKRKT